MRSDNWKIIYLYNSRTWLLYDLATDLSEQSNLASRYPKKLQQLAIKLHKELLSMDVQWPINRMNGLEERISIPFN